MAKQKLVISAVNFTTGGPLTIARDVLKAASELSDIEIYALVHKKTLYDEFSNINFIEFPQIKKNWLKRVYFEYVSCKQLSRELGSTHWLCLHDMTANTISDKKFVYCHNPSPFYKNTSFKELLYEPKFFLFSLFYKFLYRLNIRKNTAVFVQQRWLADEFCEKFNINNIVIANPESTTALSRIEYKIKEIDQQKPHKMINIIYPAIPRVFKNYEILLRAAEKLELSDNRYHFTVTFDGSESKYSRSLIKRFGHLENVTFTGYLPHEKIAELYSASDFLCFPSKLETWGLPISEAKKFGLRIILADLPYAHETIGDYPYVSFFNPNDADSLIESLKELESSKFILSDEHFLKPSQYKKISGASDMLDFILGRD